VVPAILGFAPRGYRTRLLRSQSQSAESRGPRKTRTTRKNRIEDGSRPPPLPEHRKPGLTVVTPCRLHLDSVGGRRSGFHRVCSVRPTNFHRAQSLPKHEGTESKHVATFPQRARHETMEPAPAFYFFLTVVPKSSVLHESLSGDNVPP
jgi:hypothetical protein